MMILLLHIVAVRIPTAHHPFRPLLEQIHQRLEAMHLILFVKLESSTITRQELRQFRVVGIIEQILAKVE